MSAEKDRSEIRVTLEEPYHERFEKLKEYFGILNNTEIIRFLVTKVWREVKIQEKEEEITK